MQLLWLQVTMNNFFHLKINIQELSVLDYIIRVIFENEVEKENEENTIIILTQELSVDARERRATNKTMFICHKCSYKAPSIAMLRKHEESDHIESVAYNCNQCDKTFKKKETLNQHKISDHEKEKHQCDICDEKCHATERLKQHKRACHEGRKYPCDHFDYEETIKEYLYTHSQYEHKNKSKK